MQWRRFEALFALRGLRIATRLGLGFSIVAGLLFALVAAIAYFGHLQRESLAASIEAAVARDAALANLKAIVQDRADYLRDVGTRIDLLGALRQGGELQRLAGELDQALGQLERAQVGTREREAAARLRSAEADYLRAVREANGKDDAAAASSFASFAATVSRKQAAEIERLSEGSLETYKGPVTAFVERGRVATRLVIIVTAGIALLVLLVAVGITRGITRPLREAVQAVARVSRGDLTGRVDTRGRDEAADLLRAVQTMNTHLGDMVARIRSSADAVAADAGRVAEGNEKLAERTEEQASSLEESAATIEEFTSTVKHGADGAAQASELAGEVSAMAREGGESMGSVVAGMGELAQASRRIREIVGVIDSIAFQTNILALNAAVEAARAGEEGRGFAVVAVEVRALASRAAASAREIGALVASSVERIEASGQAVDRAGATISNLVGAVDRVCALVEAIAAAGREQASGIEQINRAITQMDAVVQKNAALVSQATAAAHSLDGQAAALVETVASFRVEDERDAPVDSAGVARVEPARRALPAPASYASTGRR